MTFYAKFDISGIKKILAHSKQYPVFTPTFSQLYEGRYRKDGIDVPVSIENKVSADDVDKTKLPAMFALVKDRGAYVMALTEERLKGEKSHNFVVYCEGCDPDKDDDVYDRCRQIFGGDDFSEGLPLEWLEIAVEDAEKSGTGMMIIAVESDNLALVTTQPRRS